MNMTTCERVVKAFIKIIAGVKHRNAFFRKKLSNKFVILARLLAIFLTLKIDVEFMFTLLMKQFDSYGIHTREQIWSCIWVTVLSSWNMWHSTTNIKNVNNCNSSTPTKSHRVKPAKKRKHTRGKVTDRYSNMWHHIMTQCKTKETFIKYQRCQQGAAGFTPWRSVCVYVDFVCDK